MTYITQGPCRRAPSLAVVALLLLALVALPGGATTAAEREDADAVETQAATQSSGGAEAAEDDNGANAEPDPAEQAAAGDSPDVFVPSEAISEDFAVSFPVDI